MKAGLVILLVSLGIFSISAISATEQYVVFNGNFTNGTTLYSDIYNFSNMTVTIKGKDAYPIRENCRRESVQKI